MFNVSACDLIYSKASTALSFITSPKLPVSVSFGPLLRLTLVSINRISPPTAVHASPVTTPAYLLPWYLSRLNSGLPSSTSMSAGLMLRSAKGILPSSLFEVRNATLRKILSTCFSSCRTPLSRVYFSMMYSMAAGVNLSFAPSPKSNTFCSLGMRWRRAISFFSSVR